MTARQRPGHSPAQRGAVVVELALTLPLLLTVLAYLVFCGRLLYNYQVAQKAAHDAVRYLSSAPASSMRSPLLYVHEVAIAQAIAQAELSVLSTKPENLLAFGMCNGLPCTGSATLPTNVDIAVTVRMQNDLPSYLTDLAAPELVVHHSMRYVGQ